jgi:hypothetical protein
MPNRAGRQTQARDTHATAGAEVADLSSWGEAAHWLLVARGDDQGLAGKEPKTRYRSVEKIDGYLLEGTRRCRHSIPDDAAAQLRKPL